MQYIMEDSREAQRLVSKVDSQAWVKQYFTRHLRNGDSVLELGCGPGHLLQAISGTDTTKSFSLVGLDRSFRRLQQGLNMSQENQQFTAATGCALNLPFKSHSFDFVYCRFLLEYLKSPQSAIAEMVRVAKEGGRVLLQDLDGQLLWHFPEEPNLQQAITRVLAHLAPSGFDPFVGRKLFHYAYAAGLRDLEVDVQPYHLYAGAAPEYVLELWRLKLEIAQRESAIALGSQEEAEELTQMFMDHLARPDTLTYSVIFTVSGIASGRPPATKSDGN